MRNKLKSEEIEPKLKLRFYLKNIGMFINMKRSNRKRMEKFIGGNKLLTQPIIPDFEGTGGPMEEGMIYLLFSSNNETSLSAIDSVFRFFWVNAPDLRLGLIDGFLISEKLNSGHWEKFYSQNIFNNLSKKRYHQDIFLEGIQITFDGTWKEGYTFNFNDKYNKISGRLRYEPLSTKSVLVYYNGRMAVCPSLTQRFYDMFGIKVTGELKLQEHKITITAGRGIIEHGLGIFSNFNIHDWRWLNLQFPVGSVHLFYHSVDLKDEGIVESGEGAAVINGKWYHFQRGDFKVEEKGYDEDENIPTKVPTEWSVTAGRNSEGKKLLDLKVKSTAKLSWVSAMGRENQFLTDYLIEAEGTWKGKQIKGKGTMENQMHRIIK